MSRFALVLVLVCAAMWAGAAHAQQRPKCEMLVDASGSMRGFYSRERDNLLPEEAPFALRPLLERLRQSCPRASQFALEPRPLAAGEPFSVGTGNTDIANSLQTWSQGAEDGTFVILVTDNVEDTVRRAGSGNERFYDLLRSRGSPYAHITVIAFRAPFQGSLYLPGTPGPQANYTGPRALSIYLLGKGTGEHADGYRAMREMLRDVLGETGRREFPARQAGPYGDYILFDVRPFAQEAISLRARPLSMAESRDRGSQCARTGFRPDTGFYLHDQQMERRCEVTAVISVQIPRRWCLNQASLRAHAFIRHGSDDRLHQGLSATVSPTVADLCSEAQDLRTTLIFSPVAYREGTSFGERLWRTFRGGSEAEGQLTVAATFLRDQVNIASPITRAWNLEEPSAIATPDPAIQSRVFKLDRAVRSVVPEEALSSTEILGYPVHIRSRYAQGPLLILLVGGLILLALLVLLAMLVRRPLLLLAEGGAGENLMRLSLVRSGRVEAPDGLYVTLTNFGPLLLARSNGRILRGRLLSRNGGTIEVAPAPRGRGAPEDTFGGSPPAETDRGATFTIRRLARRRNKEVQYDDGF